MDEFITRLQQLIDYLNISPIQLADKMGVQRSTFSHLLSGRNKPGFEFLVRLHACYPEVNLNWLISGYGDITDKHDLKISHTEINAGKTHVETDLFTNIFGNAKVETVTEKQVKEYPVEEAPSPISVKKGEDETSIDRLIIVYTNGKMVELKQS